MSPVPSMPTPDQFREALATVKARRDAAAQRLMKADRETRFVLGIIGAEAGPPPFTDAELAELGAVRTDALGPLVEQLLAEVRALREISFAPPAPAPVAAPAPGRRGEVRRVRLPRGRAPADPEPVAGPVMETVTEPAADTVPEPGAEAVTSPAPTMSGPGPVAESVAPPAAPDVPAGPEPDGETPAPEARVREVFPAERSIAAARKPAGAGASDASSAQPTPLQENHKAVYELVRGNLLAAKSPLTPNQLNDDPAIQREIAKFHHHPRTRINALIFVLKQGVAAGIFEMKGSEVHLVEKGCAR